MKIKLLTAFAALSVVSFNSQATVFFDQNVTNNAIFGSGNANGSYTVDRANGIELGLRGKLRFNAANAPENTFNSNGDGSYSFAAGIAPGGFGFAPNSPTTPVWNFEWSINSNFDGSSGLVLNQLQYQLGIDFDPGLGTNFQTFDPINVLLADHSIGTNATAQGAGTEAGDPLSYVTLIGTNNLAQNSWNMEFFNNGPFSGFDPTVDGKYDFFITASNNAGVLARVDASIIVGAGAVPAPATLVLFMTGLLGLGSIRRVVKKQ